MSANKPGESVLEGARLCANMAALALFAWLGALLERFGQHPDPLIWMALAWLACALGFMLFFWGTRSAARRATKDEEANR